MINERIVNAFDSAAPDGYVKNRVFEKALQRRRAKRLVFKPAAALTATAVIVCAIVFGITPPSMPDSNMFTIKTYAMEIQNDGTAALREIDLADTSPAYMGSYIDGDTNTMYVNIGLRCEGENIANVTFLTDVGFLARQYIGSLTNAEANDQMRLYVGPDMQLSLFGRDFDSIGKTLTLDKDTARDYLLFWGISGAEAAEYFEIPRQLSLRAEVTFINGQTLAQDITIDLSQAHSVGIATASVNDLEQMEREHEKQREFLRNLPYGLCKIIQRDTLNYGDTFTYVMGNVTGYFDITEDEIELALREGLFDDDGIFRIGAGNLSYHYLNGGYEGGCGYVAMIEQGADGAFIGTVYSVPEELILEYVP